MPLLLADAARLIMPVKASTVAGEVDWLMWFNIWVCIAFGALIFIGTGWLAWRFRHKVGVNDMGRGPTHSNLLEIVWSVIPLIICLLIAVWGFKGYMNLAILPPPNDANTIEISVEGQKWNWTFEYPNGHREPTLHVPIGVKVRLVESSVDVIHSLYVPQFRIKKDAVPGRFNKQWFEATEVSPIAKDLSRPTEVNGQKTYEDLNWADPASFEVDKAMLAKGDPQEVEKSKAGFDIYCTEYCGTGHSRMLSKVFVHPDMASYKAWLTAVSDPYRPGNDGKMPSALDVGRKLVAANGCASCHSLDGTKGTGPSWKDVYGEPVSFTDGTSIPEADENYIRESILYPQKKIVAGYGGAMPNYLGKFTDRDLRSIITYMKSLSSHYKGSPDELAAPTPKLPTDKDKSDVK